MLRASIADLFLPDAARLDDRTRILSTHLLRALVAGVEADLRARAARRLAARGDAARGGTSPVLDRLMQAGVLRDHALMAELIARVRQELVARSLPIAVGSPDMPSLIVRLAGSATPAVARAAQALLVADSRRRATFDALAEGRPVDDDLPAPLRRKLTWWVAAAIRDGDDVEIDRALADAAGRRLAAQDGGATAEAAATALAVAIDADGDARAMLLPDALGDRRLGLFIALVAQGLELPLDQVRAIVLEPGGERLWLALRALELDRAVIAQIGLALADADPARDIEALADQLDLIAAVPPVAARMALAPLALHRDFRRAIAALTPTSIDRRPHGWDSDGWDEDGGVGRRR